MAALWLRADTRLFGVVFVVFNVLLGVFNILNYRVTSRTSVPCVVIVAPTSSPLLGGKDGKQVTLPASVHPTKTPVHYPPPESVLRATPRPSISSPSSSSSLPGTSTSSTRVLTANRTATVRHDVSANKSLALHWDTEQRDKYLIVKNYIPADGDPPGFNASITLSTQGTYEFLDHIQMLCKRWDGPISASVYAPGTDLPVAVRKILYLRHCGPECVRMNVSWHLIYEKILGPTPGNLETPNDAAELDVYGPINCTAGMGPLELVSEIRKAKKMPYPINVARNVARQLAKTRYVLASDIELYPSLNIIPRFLKMVSSESDKVSKTRHVFTLPIFEIKKDFQPPETKSELVQRIKSGHAIFFHKWVCDSCQNFPKRDEWLKVLPPNDTLSVFHVTKRQAPRTAWEPIYIGTNAEPLYDERLTWDGKRDKMSQMYELCLMDYDFHILDNAFLVHAPGIKTMNRQDQQRRAPFMMKNNAVHNRLLAEMRKKYGGRRSC